MTNMTNEMKSPAALRAELAMLCARYDGGAVPPGVYATIKALETALAWHEHLKWERDHVKAA